MQNSLRFGLDFGPLAAFFVTYRLAGLPTAIAVLIAMTLVSLVVTYAYERRIAVMPLVSGLAVAIFGGLTLALHDETYIKIKPTLVNLLFATILLGGVALRKPVFKHVLGHAVQLTEEGWRLLSLRWGLFFLFLAGLNEYIWRHYSTDFWVSFKVFGMFSLTLLFTLAQLPLIQKTMIEEKPDDPNS